MVVFGIMPIFAKRTGERKQPAAVKKKIMKMKGGFLSTVAGDLFFMTVLAVSGTFALAMMAADMIKTANRKGGGDDGNR